MWADKREQEYVPRGGELFGRSQIRFESKDFSGRSEAPGYAIADDASNILTDSKAQETVLGKLLTGHALESILIHALGLGDHLVSNGLIIEVVVGHTVGEDVPDRNQQSSSDSDDGLIGMFDFRKAFVLGSPIGVTADCAPGDFDHDPAEFFAAFLCDGFILVFLATVVNASP